MQKKTSNKQTQQNMQTTTQKNNKTNTLPNTLPVFPSHILLPSASSHSLSSLSFFFKSVFFPSFSLFIALSFFLTTHTKTKVVSPLECLPPLFTPHPISSPCLPFSLLLQKKIIQQDEWSAQHLPTHANTSLSHASRGLPLTLMQRFSLSLSLSLSLSVPPLILLLRSLTTTTLARRACYQNELVRKKEKKYITATNERASSPV